MGKREREGMANELGEKQESSCRYPGKLREKCLKKEGDHLCNVIMKDKDS